MRDGAPSSSVGKPLDNTSRFPVRQGCPPYRRNHLVSNSGQWPPYLPH
ncbi:MAG: hypothetical protein J6866_06375 [Victivallales bacterium]|nr:hypothetical protein [Victivallales bacterium]